MSSSLVKDAPLLAIACLLALFSVSLEIPFYFLILNGFLILWRIAVEIQWISVPSKKITSLLSLILIILTWVHFRQLSEKGLYPTFFSAICALKILDYRNLRDQKFIGLITFFLIATKFIFSIDFSVAVLAFIEVLILWLSFYQIKNSKILSLKWKLINFSQHMLIAFPIMILLYFVFPRLHPFWNTTSNISSFSENSFPDEIRPGSVAKLAQSNDLVFRVEFRDGRHIPERDLYWRGMTLDQTDGFSWKNARVTFDNTIDSKSKSVLRYTLTLEPQNDRLTFPLDVPLNLQASTQILLRKRNGSFYFSGPTSGRTILNGISDPDLTLSSSKPEAYLALPKMSDRVLALVKKLKDKSTKRSQIVGNILLYFRDNNYQYTLEPGFMDETRIDDFLFNKKSGFCEHYSSAFAILARAAGVPSRVVIGFQGGAYNTIGNFFKITKKYAHAWNEYLNDNNEWVRVDAVEYIAPSRLEFGAEKFFELPEFVQNLNLQASKDEMFFSIFWDYISLSMESLNFHWNQWLTDFNLDKQKELLSILPVPLSIFLILTIACILLMYWLSIQFKQWTSESFIIRQIYFRLLAWGRINGLPKENWEGPHDYYLRLTKVWPLLSKEFTVINDLYIRYFYYNKVVTKDSIKQAQASLKGVRRHLRQTTLSPK